ncbi:hypothetical protein WA158_003880 [Blastocystis sp. Blastoise]
MKHVKSVRSKDNLQKMEASHNKRKIILIFKLYFNMIILGFFNGAEDVFMNPLKAMNNCDRVPLEFFVRSLGFLFYAIYSNLTIMKVSEIVSISLYLVSFILFCFPLSESFFIMSVTIYFFAKSFLMGHLSSYGTILLIGPHTAMLLNWLHFFFGLGYSLGVYLCSLILPYSAIYIMILLSIICVFCIIYAIFPSTSIYEIEQVENNKPSIISACTTPIIWISSLLLFILRMTESGISYYGSKYFLLLYNLPNPESPLSYQLIVLAFYTLSRLLSGYFMDYLGHIPSLLLYLSIIFILMSIGLLIGQYGLWLFYISGFFIGPLFPTCIAFFSDILDSLFIIGIPIILAISYFFCALYDFFSILIFEKYDVLYEMIVLNFFVLIGCILLGAFYFFMKKKEKNQFEFNMYFLPL